MFNALLNYHTIVIKSIQFLKDFKRGALLSGRIVSHPDRNSAQADTLPLPRITAAGARRVFPARWPQSRITITLTLSLCAVQASRAIMPGP